MISILKYKFIVFLKKIFQIYAESFCISEGNTGKLYSEYYIFGYKHNEMRRDTDTF